MYATLYDTRISRDTTSVAEKVLLNNLQLVTYKIGINCMLKQDNGMIVWC
jgi:hypothetical protein